MSVGRRVHPGIHDLRFEYLKDQHARANVSTAPPTDAPAGLQTPVSDFYPEAMAGAAAVSFNRSSALTACNLQ